MCPFPERRIGPYKSALPHKAEVSRRKVCFWGRIGRQCRRLEPPLVPINGHLRLFEQQPQCGTS